MLDPRYRWFSITLKDENLKPCAFNFRGVTMKELRVAGKKETRFEAENYILSQTVLPVKKWESMLAGTSQRLLDEILKMSATSEDPFIEAINWIQSEYGAMEAAAVAMIPSCTPEMLESCDPYVYAKYLVMGKYQFETMYGFSIDKAWGGQPVEENNGIDLGRSPGPMAMPGPGEVATQIEDQFVWKRNK